MNVLFISLGCDKNLVDSEVMLGILEKNGFTLTDDEEKAEVIVINTCCFIGDAKEESINTILSMAEYKDSGSCKVLAVTGCLAQRYQDEILREIPQVDVLLGTASYEDIAKAVTNALKGSNMEEYGELNAPACTHEERMVTTGGHYAYLKIAEGCDKHCTYCIIPKVRGPYRSVPMDDLVAEARRLAIRGVKELILVAQETTLYGCDLYGRKCLHKLLTRLCQIDEIRWIRILYCYPEEIYDELIDTIASEEKVCHYLDIPIQHANNDILRKMGRHTTNGDLREIIAKLREKIPDIALRTTLIAGFPTETDKQHEEVMEFVNEMEFDRLGVFPYSREEDTPASLMDGQVREETKEQWRDEIMELQQEISLDISRSMIGRVIDVMIEGKVSDEPAYVARTYRDSPDVDGYLFVQTGDALNTGDFVKVRVTGAREYDLIGELENEDESTQ